MHEQASTNTQTNEAYKHITFPIDEVAENADRLANVHATPENDGIYRRGNLFYLLNDRVIPSLALASYLTSTGGNADISIENNYLVIDDKKIPDSGAKIKCPNCQNIIALNKPKPNPSSLSSEFNSKPPSVSGPIKTEKGNNS